MSGKNVNRRVLFYILVCILTAFVFQYVALFAISISKHYLNYTYETVFLSGSRVLYIPVVLSECEKKNDTCDLPARKHMNLILVLLFCLCISTYYYFKFQCIVINRREMAESLLLKHFHGSKYKFVVHPVQQDI